MPTASGAWRLLVSARGPVQLRWSGDPCAPSSRPLLSGQVRLLVVRLGPLQDAAVGPVEPEGTAQDGWCPVLVPGAGLVVESRDPQLAVGSALDGLLPVATYAIVASDVRESRPSAPASVIAVPRGGRNGSRRARVGRLRPALHRRSLDEFETMVRSGLNRRSVALGVGTFAMR